VSKFLKSELIKKDFDVDLHSVEAFYFDAYDAIIVGSPIHVGQCSKKMTKFLKDNYHLFSKKTVAFFLHV
jgi:menaquinone-dependent protoporphyrinogen IX oxidase